MIQIDNRPAQGRKILGLLSIIMLCFEALIIVEYAMQFGMQKFMTNAIRFILTAALLYWLYRGSNIARWIAFACFALGGLAGLYVVASTGRWHSRHVPMIGYYLVFAWKLARSPEVRAYFASVKEERLARKLA